VRVIVRARARAPARASAVWKRVALEASSSDGFPTDFRATTPCPVTA